MKPRRNAIINRRGRCTWNKKMNILMYFIYFYLYTCMLSPNISIKSSKGSLITVGNSAEVWGEQKLLLHLMHTESDFSCYQGVPFPFLHGALNRKIPELPWAPETATQRAPLRFCHSWQCRAHSGFAPRCLDPSSARCKLSDDALKAASNSNTRWSLYERGTKLT